jgi:soluble epoxide hydrolase/lipid-phosphate phosphatase
VPSLEVVMCEGAGHWLMVERKELITKKVDDWIENLLSKGLLDSVKSKL